MPIRVGIPDVRVRVIARDLRFQNSSDGGDRMISILASTDRCEGDANGDATVDPLDSGYVLARLGCAVGAGDGACDAADVNSDGAVDPLDSGYLLSRFGNCP
jgi:hypothetical protein